MTVNKKPRNLVKTTSLPALAASALIFGASLGNALVISEIRLDQPGTDTEEYFELKGEPGTSLDGYAYLVIGDARGGGSSPSGVVEYALKLDGLTIPASGYLLVTLFSFDETLFGISFSDIDFQAELNFENNDNVTHLLVRGYTGKEYDGTETSDLIDLDTNDDGIIDLDPLPWEEVVDAVGVIYEYDSGDFYYGAHLGFYDVPKDGNFRAAHIFRNGENGRWEIGRFAIDDPFSRDTPARPNPTVYRTEVLRYGSGFIRNTPSFVHNFIPGEVLNLSAEEQLGTTGYTFLRWEGAVTGTNPVVDLTIPAEDVTVLAFFSNGYYTAAGGEGTIPVAPTSNSGWNVVSQSEFVTFTTATSGTGSSTVGISVAPNPTSERRVGRVEVYETDLVGTSMRSFYLLQEAGENGDVHPDPSEFFDGVLTVPLGDGFWYNHGLGFLWSDIGVFPFAYLFSYANWLYFFSEGATEEGYYLYDFARSQFGFTGSGFYPFYFSVPGNEVVDLTQAP